MYLTLYFSDISLFFLLLTCNRVVRSGTIISAHHHQCTLRLCSRATASARLYRALCSGRACLSLSLSIDPARRAHACLQRHERHGSSPASERARGHPLPEEMINAVIRGRPAPSPGRRARDGHGKQPRSPRATSAGASPPHRQRWPGMAGHYRDGGSQRHCTGGPELAHHTGS